MWNKLKQNASAIAVDFFTTVMVLLVLAAIHKLTEWLFGTNAKFFGKVPVDWVFQVGDIILVGRFLWKSVKEFND